MLYAEAATEGSGEVFDDYDLTTTEARSLLIINAVFGGIFFLGLIATVMMIVKREINDLFMSRSLYCMVGALIVTIVMCLIITSYDTEVYLEH